jgi:2-polyprenyl-3-methyl-5-hydroxy-6-metoxy-1,4-benzoquinol methylase
MPSFVTRSYKKELLDRDDLPFEDIRQNMRELDVINRYLGGHKVTIDGVKKLVKGLPAGHTIHIAEIGSGGGDNLRVIREWAQKKNISVHLTGIDINEACIRFATAQEQSRDIAFIHSDYRYAVIAQKPHIIFSSLFCHHFTDEEIIVMLQWMAHNSTVGFFINDLQRHPLAYYSIKLMTRLFSKSYLVKHDAPLSVQRGFVREDWNHLFQRAGMKDFNCQWKWAFRWLVTWKRGEI